MIVKMKKAQIVVLKENYDEVIKSLQQSSVLMVINKEGGDANPSLELNEGLKSRVEETIKVTNKYQKKKGLFGDYQVVSQDDFDSVSQDTIEAVGEIEEHLERINDLNQDNKDLNETIKNLAPWKELDFIPNEANKIKYAKLHFGYVQTRNVNLLQEAIKEASFECKVYGKLNSQTALLAFSYIDDEEALNDILKKFEFTEFKLPKLDHLISDEIALKEQEIKDNNEELQSLEDKLIELSKKQDDFRVLSDQIDTQEAINNVRYTSTITTAVIEGWVREDTLDLLEQSVSNATGFYDIEYYDPAEGETPPTYTKNIKPVSQFETITDMFSKPNAKEIDPNPVMSIWYWLLFGMMMGDVGYGLLMISACMLLKKLMKPKGNMLKLFNVIMYSGVPTIFWGIIFGSYFGFNPAKDFGWDFVWYWFNPMDDPIKMLIVSVAVGGAHLVSGLVLKAIRDFKDKDYISMLSKDVSWILILCGIALFFINSYVGIGTVAVGVVLLVTLSGIRKKGVFKKVAFGVLGLYDVTSYLGDLLSYSRVMALVMSSAAVAMVMNTLAQMVGGSAVGMIFAGLIFIVGHLFNLVLGLLSAYVHDSRLQYIEFFGKFYDGGGIDFVPLSVQTKYVKEIK